MKRPDTHTVNATTKTRTSENFQLKWYVAWTEFWQVLGRLKKDTPTNRKK